MFHRERDEMPRSLKENFVPIAGLRLQLGDFARSCVKVRRQISARTEKPLAAIVKDRIDAWQKEGPENQAALIDERTGERVRFLFQLRGRKPGGDILNRTIISLLCAKAGVPTFDSRGTITSHRGRASAVTAVASVLKGMSLIELMQWSGHSSPTSTMHYIRIRPTKLAASFAEVDHMAHMVSVLIDHEMAGKQSGQSYAFYDLGDSYCTNPF